MVHGKAASDCWLTVAALNSPDWCYSEGYFRSSPVERDTRGHLRSLKQLSVSCHCILYTGLWRSELWDVLVQEGSGLTARSTLQEHLYSMLEKGCFFIFSIISEACSPPVLASGKSYRPGVRATVTDFLSYSSWWWEFRVRWFFTTQCQEPCFSVKVL